MTGQDSEVRIEAIEMDLPGPRRRTSWAYLLEDRAGGLHLIDAGADTDANFATLEGRISRIGRTWDDVVSVTLTHAHFDHAGMAARIRGRAGARVAMHRADAEAMRSGAAYVGTDPDELFDSWGVPPAEWPALRVVALRPVASGERVEVDRELVGGERLEAPGLDLEVIETPGHTHGHVCVLEHRSGTAFVGDHVLADQNPGVGLGGPGEGNPFEEYLRSLDRLEAARPRRLLPGHARSIEDPVARIGRIREHQERRLQEIEAAVRGGGPVYEVATRVGWSGGWDRLQGVSRFSALNQVALASELIARKERA